MSIRIHDVEANVQVINPETLKVLVEAVLRELDRRSGAETNQESELDLRSIVDQQRGGRR